MVQIKLDSETCRQLGAVDETAELCDDFGRVIGLFFPDTHGRGRPPAGMEIPLSDQEIERRRASRSGRTLPEILDGLGRK